MNINLQPLPNDPYKIGNNINNTPKLTSPANLQTSPYMGGETYNFTYPSLLPPEQMALPPQKADTSGLSLLGKLKNGFISTFVGGFNTVKYAVKDTYTSFFGSNIAQGLNIPATGKNPDKSTIDELLNRAADKYNVSRSVLKAIALRESDWTMYTANGTPVKGSNSTSTDWGMMQINDKAHAGAFPKAKTDIVYNIEYGAKYLSKQYRRYGNWQDAVAAYNAGSAIVKNGKYINQSYVNYVFANVNKFK